MDSSVYGSFFTADQLDREMHIKAAVAMLGKDVSSIDPQSSGTRLGILSAYLGGTTCWMWLAVKKGLKKSYIRSTILDLLERDKILSARSDTSGSSRHHYLVKRFTLTLICGVASAEEASSILEATKAEAATDKRSYHWLRFLASRSLGDTVTAAEELASYSRCKGKADAPLEPVALGVASLSGGERELLREVAKVEKSFDRLLGKGFRSMPSDAYWPWSACAILVAAGGEHVRRYDSFWLPNAVLNLAGEEPTTADT